MPDGLFPTKTRLALLRRVAAGRVNEDDRNDAHDGVSRVTARLAELRQAGWVEPGAWRHSKTGWRTGRTWQITAAGAAILDQHQETQS